LASNENPLGPSPRAAEAFERAIRELHRYPDGGATALRVAIGAHHGLDPARIVCGTGSDELFALLASSYAGEGDEVLYSAHGFLAYPIVAQSAGATPITAPETNLKTDIDAILAAVGPLTRMIFWPIRTTRPGRICRRVRSSACWTVCPIMFCWCLTRLTPNMSIATITASGMNGYMTGRMWW